MAGDTPTLAEPPASRRFGNTNFGIIGFIAAVVTQTPLLLELAGVRLPQRIQGNLGVIYFDYGLEIDLLVVILCLAGLGQPGRNRWVGLAGLVITSIWYCTVLFSSII